MIKYYLLFLLVNVTAIRNSNAQWTTLNTGTSVTLEQVVFVNDSIGYLLSSNGAVFKTIDGGQSWSNPSKTNSCTSIYFVSADTGFACDANYGTGIYKTTDGGQSWT